MPIRYYTRDTSNPMQGLDRFGASATTSAALPDRFLKSSNTGNNVASGFQYVLSDDYTSAYTNSSTSVTGTTFETVTDIDIPVFVTFSTRQHLDGPQQILIFNDTSNWGYYNCTMTQAAGSTIESTSVTRVTSTGTFTPSTATVYWGREAANVANKWDLLQLGDNDAGWDLSQTGGVINFWNKSFLVNNFLDPFHVPALNGRHINLWNCFVNIQNQNYTLWNTLVPGLGESPPQATANTAAGSRTFNMYGCDLQIQSPYNDSTATSVITLNDFKDSTLTAPQANDFMIVYSGHYANWNDSEVVYFGPNGGQWSVFRCPSSLRGIRTINILINMNSEVAASAGGGILFTELDFGNPEITRYFQSQFGQRSQEAAARNNSGINLLGPFYWANVSARMDQSHVFGTKINWSAIRGRYLNQYYALGSNYYLNAAATTAAEGIRVYVPTDMGLDDSETDIWDKIEETKSTTVDLIHDYKTGSDGELQSNRYSLNGASSWNNGFYNFGRFSGDSTQDADIVMDLNTVPVQQAPENVMPIPVQITKEGGKQGATGAQNLYGQAGLRSWISARGYAYSNGAIFTIIDEDVLTDGQNMIVKTPEIDLPSDVVKSANIVSTDKAARTNVDARFPNSANTTCTVNDVHDAARWLWSDYQLHVPPTITGDVAILKALPEMSLTSAATAADTVINVSHTFGYSIGDEIRIDNSSNQDVRTITALTSTSITFATGLTHSYATGTGVFPGTNTSPHRMKLQMARSSTPFSYAANSHRMSFSSTTLGVGSGEAIQGLEFDELLINTLSGRIHRGSYKGDIIVSQGLTHSTEINNLVTSSIFSECTLDGTITINMTGTGNLYIGFNDCSIASGGAVTINKGGTGTGTLFVQGAPSGVTLGTGVEAITSIAVNFNFPTVTGATPRLTCHQYSGTGATRTIGDQVFTFERAAADLNVSSSTFSNLTGTVVLTLSGIGVSDTIRTVDLGSTGGAFSVSMNNELIGDTNVTVPAVSGASAALMRVASSSVSGDNNAVGDQSGVFTIGITNTRGAFALTSAQLNSRLHSVIRQTTEYGKFIAVNDNRANCITNESNGIPIVNSNLVRFTPYRAEDEFLPFVERPTGVSTGQTTNYTVSDTTYTVTINQTNPGGISVNQVIEACRDAIEQEEITNSDITVIANNASQL